MFGHVYAQCRLRSIRRSTIGTWLLVGTVLVIALPAVASGVERVHTVSTVEEVDLQRYVGLWYEIARIPNRFQDQCAYGTTARYTLREDGRLDVVNRCFEKDGDSDEAEGIARVVDTQSNAKLEVSFVSFLGWRPFWGDYWVIGLDQDYGWAVVGTPDNKYGWVLAREPRLDENSMAEVRAVLSRNGYDWSDFVTSDPEPTAAD